MAVEHEQRSAARRAPSAAAAEPAAAVPAAACCPQYHEAIEFLGKRWTGAIVRVLMHRSPLRFTEIAHAVPQLSDRLLSERMKELEARGVVVRTELPGRPPRVEYALTPMGRELEPALGALEAWAQRWLPPCGDERAE
ncbi:winged helix-turn-helix transcriptional regulator [Conexibacter arvalis]|uniref:DNA-binding HxlR family transcriptional regulator n=1 Tax=Conexibacter arvalis TaxID=912552 RepID=A0A840IIX3_9ACTN|nr:helix-turn-helix domain-containing protein [Conexibacter arvalis]MBB4664181.1 DNA-binding HxlR family transcriptional regulator [Conexibacter arvalis]